MPTLPLQAYSIGHGFELRENLQHARPHQSGDVPGRFEIAFAAGEQQASVRALAVIVEHMAGVGNGGVGGQHAFGQMRRQGRRRHDEAFDMADIGIEAAARRCALKASQANSTCLATTMPVCAAHMHRRRRRARSPRPANAPTGWRRPSRPRPQARAHRPADADARRRGRGGRRDRSPCRAFRPSRRRPSFGRCHRDSVLARWAVSARDAPAPGRCAPR